MRTSAYLLRKYAPAAGGTPRSGEAGVPLDESAFPKIHPGRWGGQRDVRVFASQIRTGFRRLSAPSPARYKRFAFALRSHPGGFESRRFIEKSTAPKRCRAFTFFGAGNGTRTRECQLGKLMPYHLAMPAIIHSSKSDACLVYTEPHKGAIYMQRTVAHPDAKAYDTCFS